MTRKTGAHVVIGNKSVSASTRSVLLPDGTHARVMDRHVFRNALDAAEDAFSKAIKERKLDRERTKRSTAA